jgi:hypothetical protein
MSEVIVELTRTVLVDVTKMKALSTTLFAETMASLGAMGKPIRYVSTFDGLATQASILRALQKGEDVSDLIEFRDKEPVTEAQLEILNDYVRAYVAASELLKPPGQAGYPFATVPDGKESLPHLNITTKSVGRAHYRISLNQLEKIWNQIREYWAGIGVKPELEPVRAENSTRYVQKVPDGIRIDCQTLYRWEIEQVAKRLGWAFP